MAFTFLACANVSQSPKQPVESDIKVAINDSFEANQYAVYDALIANVFSNPYLLIITERTNTDYRDDPMLEQVLANMQKELLPLSNTTLNDFRVKNKNRVPLKDAFTLGAKQIFITDEELETITKDGLDWKSFYEKYPNSEGVLTLSNVGFDAEMKQAFVYLANSRGSLNGVGLYVLLEKQNDVWQVKKRATGWMS
ncbi:MAG TPA: hypothetical protein VF692_11220 [Pyrinomonadaceae bacterium]|jgi:hypothetical protein